MNKKNIFGLSVFIGYIVSMIFAVISIVVNMAEISTTPIFMIIAFVISIPSTIGYFKFNKKYYN